MKNNDTVKKRNAAAAGNIGIDIIPQFKCKESSCFDDVIKPGHITHIEGSEIHPGGSTANTGLAMNIFGTDTIICGKTGNDHFGQMLRNMITSLAGKKAASGLIPDEDIHTAWSVILAVPGLDRSILQNPGANDLFGCDDIDFDTISECSLLHFGHPPSMKKMYSNEGEELTKLFKKAHSNGLLTSLDMCSVDPDSDAGKQDWKKILEHILPLTDFFVPSEDELRYMLKAEKNAAPDALAAEARKMGASNILIKCGSKGMYYSNGDAQAISEIASKLEIPAGSMESWTDANGYAPAKKVKKEVSGLGAGDTSIAAYLSAMLQGLPFEKCVDLALTEGALCVGTPDALSGLLPFEQL